MVVELFLESIKSPRTKEIYGDAVTRFCLWSGIKEAKLAKTPAKTIQTKLIEYVIYLKNQGRSFSLQNVAISAVKKYCEAFDVEVNFAKVYRYVGEQTTNHEDKPYSTEQLRTMVATGDPRAKALILLLDSTGVRAGAVPGMLIRDLTKIEDKGLYKVVVYANSPKDRYFTFTTPEAAQAIDAYLDIRKVAGEVIKPTAPLFRKEFNHANANNPEPLGFGGTSAIIQRTLVKAGLRVLNDEPNFRHTTAMYHGFRKFFNTALVRAGVKPVVVEILTGHTIGLQKNYLRLDEAEVLAEYLKAVDLLTIGREKSLLKQVEKLQTEIADVDAMKRAYLDIKQEASNKDKTVDELKDMLGATNDLVMELKAEVERMKKNKH
jgi:integrase